MAETTEQTTTEEGTPRRPIEDILKEAQERGGEAGAPVLDGDGNDTGYKFDLSGSGRIPTRKGSRFMPGHDAKMYGLNRRYLAGEIEINDYQRAYMEERGMPLDRQEFQREVAEKEAEKAKKKEEAQVKRDAKKEEEAKAAADGEGNLTPEEKKEARRQAREDAKKKRDEAKANS